MIRNTYIEGLSYPENHPFRKDAERLILDFDERAMLSKDGIVRWKSNSRIPPSDILTFWVHVGKRFDFHKCVELSKQETEAFLTDYRKRAAKQSKSDEEIGELLANHGEFATVMNVVTNKYILIYGEAVPAKMSATACIDKIRKLKVINSNASRQALKAWFDVYKESGGKRSLQSILGI